jgi:hypothetical protein
LKENHSFDEITSLVAHCTVIVAWLLNIEQ